MSKSVPKLAPGKATHFLCYPLYNSRSRLHLHSLLQRLRDDEHAAGCPQKAFRLPKSYHLRIATFIFKSRHHVDVASDLLHSLEINRMLRHAATEAAANASNQNELSPKTIVAESGQTCDGIRDPVPPLYVSLTGIAARPFGFQRFRSTYAVPTDYSNRLLFLSKQILQCFISEGFEELLTQDYDDHCKLHFARPNLICTQYASKTQLFVDEKGRKFEKHIESDYDSQNLIEKYKDVVLADKMPLEKLSLWENGRKATFQGARNEILLDEYYEEIDSIPLPQEA